MIVLVLLSGCVDNRTMVTLDIAVFIRKQIFVFMILISICLDLFSVLFANDEYWFMKARQQIVIVMS